MFDILFVDALVYFASVTNQFEESVGLAKVVLKLNNIMSFDLIVKVNDAEDTAVSKSNNIRITCIQICLIYVEYQKNVK